MRVWAAFLLVMLTSLPAAAESLVTSLSSHRVLISSNYTGTSIAVFGAIERDAQTVARATGYDAVVTVRGPRQLIVVREKQPLGPVWLNREQQKFPMAPAYLSVLTSRPVEETSYEKRERLRDERAALVKALSRRTGEPYKAVHARINQATGAVSVAKATVAQLEKGNRRLEKLLAAKR